MNVILNDSIPLWMLDSSVHFLLDFVLFSACKLVES